MRRGEERRGERAAHTDAAVYFACRSLGRAIRSVVAEQAMRLNRSPVLDLLRNEAAAASPVSRPDTNPGRGAW